METQPNETLREAIGRIVDLIAKAEGSYHPSDLQLSMSSGEVNSKILEVSTRFNISRSDLENMIFLETLVQPDDLHEHDSVK